jgi:nucleoside-diphosphate-sugar epimerase
MRALVTGGGGFTGSHLVRRLLARGYEVTILDLQRGLFADELERDGAHFVTGSVTDAELVNRTTEGHDVVYHLAAAFRQITAPKQFYNSVNVDGTRNVLNAAEKHSVAKVVHCSTAGVHGGRKFLPWDEDSPIAPGDLYQQTKWQGERVCREFMERGLNITIVRPTSEYGPGDVHGMRFLYRLVRSGRFLMFGSGRVTVHPVYIENLMDLFDLVTDAPVAKGRTYIGGDEAPCTLNELVTAVGGSIGVDVNIVHLPLFWPLWLASAGIEFACMPFRISPPLFRRRVNWYRNRRAYRIDRAKRELGYQPRVSLEHGLQQTAAWYREMGYI